MLYLFYRNEAEAGSAEVQPARNNPGHRRIYLFFDSNAFRRTQVGRLAALERLTSKLSVAIYLFCFHAEANWFSKLLGDK